MSWIPGTVGGAPVQNAGAYGQEIKDTLTYVEAYDIEAGKFVKIQNEDCHFSYRNSLFKENQGKYIITAVNLEMHRKFKGISNYPSLQKYFAEKGIEPEMPADIRNAIIEIRKSKLPDPKEIPNAGSFFKNPIVSVEIFEKLQKNFPTIPFFNTENKIKIPAGWLIDQCGLKGYQFGNFRIYEKNALIITHNGKGKLEELREFVKFIQEKVFKKFGLNLEIEPVFVN
jgi:UDP-N-acetylmuramate dehydrogenase